MEGEMYQFDKEKQMLEFSECAGQPEQMSQGESKVRRKRKKVKGEERAGGPKKRKLSTEQVRFLEMSFGCEHKLEAARKDRLATELGLEPRQVAVWFQNRRVRWKCKQMEEEYVKLKKMHELVLLQKCQLEDQVVKLREQLSEVERETRKLSKRHDETTLEGGNNERAMGDGRDGREQADVEQSSDGMEEGRGRREIVAHVRLQQQLWGDKTRGLHAIFLRGRTGA